MTTAHALPLFSWLVGATVKGSVVIVLMALLIALFGRRLGARWRHALWLIVLVRLALPVAPASSWSLFNLLQFGAPQVALVQPAPLLPLENFRGSIAFSRAVVAFAPSPLAGFGSTLLAVWLAGAALIVGRLLFVSFQLHRAVRRAARRQEHDRALVELVDALRRKLGIRRRVRVVLSDIVKTPALHGLLRPTLLLPARIPESFATDELRHVILHELWHLRRHDVAVNWLLSVAQAFHWFNPLVWFAVMRIKEEREICCDELALSCLEEEERTGYGRTILKLLEQFRTAAPVPALVGIVNHKQQMKRRLTMIASFQSRTRFSVLFLGVVAFVGAVAFTDARGGERRLMKKLDAASCAMFGRLDQKVSVDLTNASFGELLSAVAAKGGMAVNQSPELATLPVQQARFTVHATNVPAHMLLMEALMPFDLAATPGENGLTIQKGESCSLLARHEVTRRSEDTETRSDDGKVERRVVKIITGPEAEAHAEAMAAEGDDDAPAGGVNVNRRVMMRAHATGECKLSADGKLHRDVTVKFEENGVQSEGKLQLDIDAPAAATK
jgi:beta-lactamase regulating signal transducer with metallopeptidase domain